jgi:hypothetical protein
MTEYPHNNALQKQEKNLPRLVFFDGPYNKPEIMISVGYARGLLSKISIFLTASKSQQ